MEREKPQILAVTTSEVKRKMIFECLGGASLVDQKLMDAIHVGEERLYEKYVRQFNNPAFPDGLLFPFYVLNGQKKVVSIVELAARAKANAAFEFLTDNPMDIHHIHINDSLWAVSEDGTKLMTAINKAANPHKNGEDAKRLSNFFEIWTGSAFFSASSNIFIDLENGDMQIINRSLEIGRVSSQPSENLEKMFTERFKQIGAFDLQFIMESGLIKINDKLQYYYEGLPGENSKYIELNLNETSYDKLHLAAHGLTL